MSYHRQASSSLEDEDTEEADLERDVLDEVGDRPAFWDQEVREVDQLLEEMEQLPTERKFVELRQRLQQALYLWDQVLVFTEYTDTLDFLRQGLLHSFGSKLGCYSGRGGEVWDTSQQRWVGISKERIQQHFSVGQLKVLLCTEAAGEGLNLQNCGVLINYDMPWNPMRVEQRIGRVDRIGQRRREVLVTHFFYEGTVEAQVYKALGDRIGWFETVVGQLQPILQRAHTAIQRIAMADPEERGPVVEEELGRLAQEHETGEDEIPAITHWEPVAGVTQPEAAATRHDLHRFLSATGDAPATTTVTYGSPVLHAALRLPPPHARPDVLRLKDAREAPHVGYYRLNQGRWTRIQSVQQLVDAVDRAAVERPQSAAEVHQRFEADCTADS